MLSNYDVTNIQSIINGEGDWFSAHTIRYLHEVLYKADNENFAKLYAAFPDICVAILKNYGWDNVSIDFKISSSILRDV